MTTHEDHQAQLLDAYLSALQNDKNAPIPDELDPDIAEFARLFVSEHANNKAPATQSRVWQQIQATQNTTPTNIREMDSYMTNLAEKQKRSSKQSGFLPLAATAVIAVIVSLGLGVILFSNDGDSQQGADILVVTATVMPIVEISVVPTLIPSATATPNPTQRFTPTPIPSGQDAFALTATQIVLDAPQTEVALQLTVNSLNSPTLRCDFEGELVLRINQNEIRTGDILTVGGAARNEATERVLIEIFGGFLTDDQFQLITEIDAPSPAESVLTLIDGADYAAGSYLLQLRTIDASGETLSSCALPVTFIAE